MSNADRPLKILLISRRFPPQIGGAERVMANLAQELANQHQEVTILSSSDPADCILATTDQSQASPAQNPKLIRLKYSGVKVAGTFAYLFRISRWIKQNRPDIVYVSMLKHDAWAAVKTCRQLRIPVVLRPEGAGLTGDMAWQNRHWFGRLARSQTLRADAIVALSERVREELVLSGFHSDKIHFIANGIPVPEQAWSPNAHRRKQVLFVGRLAFEKGLDILIKSWPEVLKSHPDARLKLIGSGPFEPTLQQLAAELKVTQSVEFPGSKEQITPELMQSAVFVLPSREEGLSIALLEAMALGMPVVVSDIPGNRTLVTDKITGRLAEPENPARLAGKLNQSLALDPPTLDMAESGRNLVARSFSMSAMTKSHMELFISLIKQSAN